MSATNGNGPKNANDDFSQFFADEEPQIHELRDEMNTFMLMYQEWLETHEAEVHDGERCPTERANFVAFVINRLGLGKEDWEQLLVILEWYEAHHEHKE